MPRKDEYIWILTRHRARGSGGGGWAVDFNGQTSKIDCGSDSSLDDLHDAEFTAEAWIRPYSYGESSNGSVLAKADVSDAFGWDLRVNNTVGMRAKIRCLTTSASSDTGTDEFAVDGEWHHVVMYFNDAGDRKIYLAVDGVWVTTYQAQNAGVGAIKSDAGYNLLVGNWSNGARTFDGYIGWVRISNNDRYNHGTDFTPPSRTALPLVDANTVEMWGMSEGSGSTAVAKVNTPTNDGTITDGTWVRNPPPSLANLVIFNGTTSAINCGSDASLDDLHDAEFTAEMWIAPNKAASMIRKGNQVNTGWYFSGGSSNRILGVAWCSGTTNAQSISAFGAFVQDGTWNHVAMYYNDAGDRKVYLAINGTWLPSYATQTAGDGAVNTDISEDLIIGKSVTADAIDGYIGWVRISDNDRYSHGTDFTPPPRTRPPSIDANTVEQWNLDEGSGSSAAAQVTTPTNDGTITDGTWQYS